MPAARPAAFMSSVLLLAGVALPGAPWAAESYDNCTGFIDTLPAVVSSQGTWCLRRDLSTAITAGHAIEVTANNVTLDCNGFKVGGLAGGPSSVADGIFTERSNLTVRACSVRGFFTAIAAVGSGHLVEDNRIEGALSHGISVEAAAGMVRRNFVLTTGGSSLGNSPRAINIVGGVDVIDNTVDGSASSSRSSVSFGIVALATSDISIAHNRVRNIASPVQVPSGAIVVHGSSTGSVSLRENTLGNSAGAFTVGIRCHGPMDIASGNHLVGFTSSLVSEDCTVGPGNVER